MLDVKNIKYKFKKSKFSLNDISFSLDDGFMMCLLGKNGAGKTTLLKVIYGIFMPDEGIVSYMKKTCVKRCSSNEAAGLIQEYHKEVAFISDEDWCMSMYTVDENIKALKGLYENFDEKEFEKILKRFDFAEKSRDLEYHKLSTGQKLMVQIAFNLARHPKLLIMDEPLANLDPVIKEDLLELIREKIANENISVIMSTHLVEEISDMVDYIGVLEDGCMKEFGDREEILTKYNTNNLRGIFAESEEGGVN